jgi:conjugal transfer pilin signal peptidase TrbI
LYGASKAFVRGAKYWVPPLAALLVLSHFFALSFNFTDSLPDRAFVVIKNDKEPQRGHYVQFLHPGGGPFPAGAPFVKIVLGVPGDVVTSSAGRFYVNGEFVGEAKKYSKSGMPLKPGPVGVIPAGFYFVQTPHPDSFDSRYDGTGWVHGSRIVGRAVPLF